MRHLHGWVRNAAMAVAGAMLVAGCGQRTPEGQIIAIVNGDDITTHDLARLQSRLPAGTRPDAALRRQLIEALIDGRLAVQEATKQGLAKTPEYLDASSEANDAILINLLNDHIAQGLQSPSPADVDRYIASHPNRFSGRQIVRLDQVRFTRTDATMAAIAKVATLEQVEAALKAQRTPYQRGVVTVDTLALPDAALEQLATLPATRLLGDQQGTTVSVSQVLDRIPKPVSDSEARDVATALIGRDAARDALVALHARLRQSAQVRYQKGYAPASPAPAK